MPCPHRHDLSYHRLPPPRSQANGAIVKIALRWLNNEESEVAEAYIAEVQRSTSRTLTTNIYLNNEADELVLQTAAAPSMDVADLEAEGAGGALSVRLPAEIEEFFKRRARVHCATIVQNVTKNPFTVER